MPLLTMHVSKLCPRGFASINCGALRPEGDGRASAYEPWDAGSLSASIGSCALRGLRSLRRAKAITQRGLRSVAQRGLRSSKRAERIN